MSDIEARIVSLEARVKALEGKPASGGGDTLPLEKLSAPWADKTVRKSPPKHTGRDLTGLRYSELTTEECLTLAGFYEWKAKKGRDEVPVRMNNAGKPWHESDAFEAKILRTWAAAAGQSKPAASGRYGSSGGGSAKHSAPSEAADPGYDDFADAGDDSIPFAVPFDVAPRHMRRRNRWEKF